MVLNNLSIAVLVDGGFFLNRYKHLYKNGRNHTAEQTAKNIIKVCMDHVGNNYLYRIFYYDSVPLSKKIHNPISNKVMDLGKSEIAKFRNDLFDELRKKRKVALRLGYLKDSREWQIRSRNTKDLLKGKLKISDLNENDIEYKIRQKGVDMKIGIDIASISLKKQVDRIVLISGDSDFVPAAKLARREGIDFVLDPMWNHVEESLFEHIDGLKSYSPKPLHFS